LTDSISIAHDTNTPRNLLQSGEVSTVRMPPSPEPGGKANAEADQGRISGPIAAPPCRNRGSPDPL
jgi:hypothetical protein